MTSAKPVALAQERAGLGGARQAAKPPGVSPLNKGRVVGSPSATKGQPKAKPLNHGAAAG